MWPSKMDNRFELDIITQSILDRIILCIKAQECQTEQFI